MGKKESVRLPDHALEVLARRGIRHEQDGESPPDFPILVQSKPEGRAPMPAVLLLRGRSEPAWGFFAATGRTSWSKMMQPPLSPCRLTGSSRSVSAHRE